MTPKELHAQAMATAKKIPFTFTRKSKRELVHQMFDLHRAALAQSIVRSVP